MKVLFFATNSFPYGKGEPLVSNQINYLSKDFDKIVIISSEGNNKSLFELPSNVEHYNLNFDLTILQKLYGLMFFFSKNVREEIKFIKSQYSLRFSFKILKIMLNSYVLGLRYESFLKKYLKKNRINQNQVFFHSYWCRESVIGFALIKQKYPNIKMDTRLHAYELYLERHDPKYLPFRKLIIDNIDQLIFISSQGLEYFRKLYKGVVNEEKLVINRLGVIKKFDYINDHKIQKAHLFRIVTCAALIELKRLDLLINALSEIDDIQMEWVHFGNGILQNEIQSLAKEKLGTKTNITYSFNGFVDNNEIQEYYFSNHIDLFINTSLYEGIPISIMEAMSYGIPCIATNVGGVSEIVNEENGFLLNVDFKISELSQILINYFNSSSDNKIHKSENAYKTWNEKYNGVENYKSLYKIMVPSHKFCSKCLFDNIVYPEIYFDEKGVCNVCHIYEDLQNRTVFKNEIGKEKLNNYIAKIKSEGSGKKYDCILGISGGVDSSFLAYKLKEWGVNPLIVHVDNGWNSELAVSNIEKIVKKLDFDLYTHVIDWEEMRDLQLSFFKASVIDIDIPFDNVCWAILYKLCLKYNIKYMFSGHNTVTEGWMPDTFVHYKLDTINIKDIHRKFGEIKLKNTPLIGPIDMFYYKKVRKIEFVTPLDWIEYNKEEVKKTLIEKFDWRDYGGKHYENIFTKFYQGYILVKKFKIDKRISHLSTLICSGQMSKKEALEEMKKTVYNPLEIESDKIFFIKKMNLTLKEFDDIMDFPVKKHTDYRSYLNVYKVLSKIKKIFK